MQAPVALPSAATLSGSNRMAKKKRPKALEDGTATADAAGRLQPNQDIVTLDLHREALEVQAGVVFALSAVQVERPAMPGAGQDAAVDFAFMQRAGGMRADALGGDEFAVDQKYRYRLVADRDPKGITVAQGLGRADLVVDHAAGDHFRVCCTHDGSPHPSCCSPSTPAATGEAGDIDLLEHAAVTQADGHFPVEHVVGVAAVEVADGIQLG